MRALALVALVLMPGDARAGSLPSRVGACAVSTICRIGTRTDGPGHISDQVGGTEVIYANGLYSASYDGFDAVVRYRVGDRVRACLVSIPRHCPPGDARGRLYAFTNLRTGERWRMKDFARGCGGA